MSRLGPKSDNHQREEERRKGNAIVMGSRT